MPTASRTAGAVDGPQLITRKTELHGRTPRQVQYLRQMLADDITFGIIADLGDGERLWLKTNDQTIARFQAEGCPRFAYQAKGRDMALHYHAAPETAMESPELMREWAQLAWQAALAAQARPQPQKKPRP